jgi:Bacterial membrane protein YfhO
VLLFLYNNFDYTTATDQQLLKHASTGGSKTIELIRAFVNGLKADRQGLFRGSLLRSFLFIAAAALAIGLQVKNKIRPGIVLGLVGILSFVDVMGMDREYLNDDNYQQAGDYQKNFAATPADIEILHDKGYYRVFDLRDSADNALNYGAMTAWFHSSIGGYHAAKLKIYEDLINYQLINYPDCRPVINMLNTKYIIANNSAGNDSIYRNPGALGPVWFVKAVRFLPTPLAVMNALTRSHPKDTAILFEGDRKQALSVLLTSPHLQSPVQKSGRRMLAGLGLTPGLMTDATRRNNGPTAKYPDNPALRDTDSTASIQLVKNDNDEILYRSDANTSRFAVFSEIFYSRGWQAWIDDKEAPILRTDYVLRGLSIPAGHHYIRFAFRPQSYYMGRQLQWMATILLILLIVAAGIVSWQDYLRKGSDRKGFIPTSDF